MQGASTEKPAESSISPRSPSHSTYSCSCTWLLPRPPLGPGGPVPCATGETAVASEPGGNPVPDGGSAPPVAALRAQKEAGGLVAHRPYLQVTVARQPALPRVQGIRKAEPLQALTGRGRLTSGLVVRHPAQQVCYLRADRISPGTRIPVICRSTTKLFDKMSGDQLPSTIQFLPVVFRAR